MKKRNIRQLAQNIVCRSINVYFAQTLFSALVTKLLSMASRDPGRSLFPRKQLAAGEGELSTVKDVSGEEGD